MSRQGPASDRVALACVVVGVLLAGAGCRVERAARAASTVDTSDSSFRAMQARGADPRAMGVDQYTSVHVFDALPDGGRIELQRVEDDSAGIAQIRRHLHAIATAFASGDFSTPAFVHMTSVPGTRMMAARRQYISYEEHDLPRGGELRITTHDPQALAGIRDFMTYQRDEHHAGGMTGMSGMSGMHDSTR